MVTSASLGLVLGLIAPYAAALSSGVLPWEFFAGRAPQCTAAEKVAVQSELAVSMRMTGKFTTNETIMPEETPAACKFSMFAMGTTALNASVQECYVAWGMTEAIAACWTAEFLKKTKSCMVLCALPVQQKSTPCLECQTSTVVEKFTCTGKANGVGAQCAACRAGAQKFYAMTCLPTCTDSDKDESLRPACRSCSDKFWAQWEGCF